MKKFIRKFRKYRPVFTLVAEICSVAGFIIALLMML